MLFRCEASADRKTVQLDIFDRIGEGFFTEGVTSKSVRALLRENKGAETVKVRMNTRGGDVIEGFAIYNLLAEFPGRVELHIEALAASMGSIIAMAADEITIAKTGFVMIHNPSGHAGGGAKDFRQAADTLEKMTANMVDTYVGRTGRTKDEVTAWMDAETWFTAKQALKLGFVDRVTSTKPAATGAAEARFTAEADATWRNAPAAVIEMLGKCATVEPMPSSDPNEPEIEIVADADETDGMKEILAQLAAISERLTKIEGAAPVVAPAAVAAPEASAETTDADLQFDLERSAAFEGFVSDGKVPNTADARARFMKQAKDAKALEQVVAFYTGAKPVVSTAAHQFAPAAELEPGTVPKLGAQALKICRDMNWKPEELYKD